MTAEVISQSETYVQVPTRLIRELKGTEFLIYAALVAYGHRSPRTAELAEITGLSIHTVRAAIQHLRKNGYITTTMNSRLNFKLTYELHV